MYSPRKGAQLLACLAGDAMPVHNLFGAGAALPLLLPPPDGFLNFSLCLFNGKCTPDRGNGLLHPPPSLGNIPLNPVRLKRNLIGILWANNLRYRRWGTDGFYCSLAIFKTLVMQWLQSVLKPLPASCDHFRLSWVIL